MVRVICGDGKGEEKIGGFWVRMWDGCLVERRKGGDFGEVRVFSPFFFG